MRLQETLRKRIKQNIAEWPKKSMELYKKSNVATDARRHMPLLEQSSVSERLATELNRIANCQVIV
jgi:hypothetical protein